MLTFNSPPTLDSLLKLKPNAQAFFWDMDGTIMRTEWLHAQALGIQLEKLSGIKLKQDDLELLCTGRTDHQIYTMLGVDHPKLLQNMEALIDAKNKIVEELVPSVPAHTIVHDEIKDLIMAIAKAGYRQAVVTSAERAITTFMFDKLALHPYFHFSVTREDTSLNKPHPAPYFRAMEEFKVTPENSIIFEDSETGLAAARSTGAFVIKARWYESVLD